MHIALNGWFWTQPYTGSGQMVRRLVTMLRRIAPEVRLTLVLPPGQPVPADLPEGVQAVTTRGPGGNLGKVWFEQRPFPAAAAAC